MVAVVEQLGGALGESGLLVLPCIAAHLNQVILEFFFNFLSLQLQFTDMKYHLLQIIFDSFLVSIWFQKEHDLKTA